MSWPRKRISIALTATSLILAGALGRPWFAGSRAQQKPGASQPAISPTPQQRPQQTRASDDKPELINTDLISLIVTVTDSHGRLVSGLEKSNFTVYDEKQKQEITLFSDDDAPVSVGMVYDLTASMKGGKENYAQNALVHFFENSHPDDDYFLITLKDGHPHLTMDRTRDSKAIMDKLIPGEARGYTAFYDGVYLAAERVQRGTHPKQALLVISDGQDNNSRYSLGQLKQMLKETDIAVYLIGVGVTGPLVQRRELSLDSAVALQEIAAASGGKAYLGNTPLTEVYEEIALELRHQYALGYKPANFKADGAWHHVKVKVTPPPGSTRLFVRTRAGYFAVPRAH